MLLDPSVVWVYCQGKGSIVLSRGWVSGQAVVAIWEDITIVTTGLSRILTSSMHLGMELLRTLTSFMDPDMELLRSLIAAWN